MTVSFPSGCLLCDVWCKQSRCENPKSYDMSKKSKNPKNPNKKQLRRTLGHHVINRLEVCIATSQSANVVGSHVCDTLLTSQRQECRHLAILACVHSIFCENRRCVQSRLPRPSVSIVIFHHRHQPPRVPVHLPASSPPAPFLRADAAIASESPRNRLKR